MTLFSKIQEELKTAMKAGDKETTQSLRFLTSEIKSEAVNNNLDRENIADETVIKVVEKSVKRLKDSIKIFTEQSRLDLAESEQKELKIIEAYLPAQLSDEELKAIVEKVKAENPNLQGMAIMGKIMPQVKGKADPERVRSLLM